MILIWKTIGPDFIYNLLKIFRMKKENKIMIPDSSYVEEHFWYCNNETMAVLWLATQLYCVTKSLHEIVFGESEPN